MNLFHQIFEIIIHLIDEYLYFLRFGASIDMICYVYM